MGQDLFIYKVQKDDTLIAILIHFRLRPVHGDNGSLQVAIALNPTTVFEGGQLIFPGSQIKLPLPLHGLKLRTPSADENPRVEPSSGLKAATSQDQAKMTKPQPLPSEAGAPTSSSPTPTPSAKVNVNAQPDGFVRYSEISTAALGEYKELVGYEPANSTSARLLTKFGTGLNLQWKQHWSEAFATHISFQWTNDTFVPTPSGVPIYGSNQSLFGFGGGIDYRWTSFLAFHLSANDANELYYEGNPTGNEGLVVNQVSDIVVHPQLELTVLDLKPFTLSALIGTSFYTSTRYADYQISGGYGADAGVRVQQSFSSGSLGCELFYSNRHQTTSIVILTEKDLGVSCGYSWKL